MKLKKWGSLLTAISMVASMAAYVPATVSANEISANYSAVQLAAEETEVVTTSLFSGTFDADLGYGNVAFDVSKVTTGGESAEFVLTLSPKTAGASYVVPNDIMYQFVYAILNSTDEDTAEYKTVSGAVEKLTAIKITGAAKISKNAFVSATDENSSALAETAVLSQALAIDCEASYDADGTAKTYTAVTVDTSNKYNIANTASIGGYTSDISALHEMTANTSKKNHKCADCGIVDASFEAHGFDMEDGATVGNGAHICACGKSSEDYKTETGYTYNAHSWNENNKHICDDCGADQFFAHTAVYKETDKLTHTKKCSELNCGKTLSSAEVHNFGEISSAEMGKYGIAHTCGTAVTGENNEVTYENGCGAVHDEDEHTYAYKWIANDDKELELVEATDGVVCACGWINPEHGAHNYVTENDYHICACGATETDHNYTMKYNNKGVLVSANDGVICQDCGKVNPTHISEGCQNGTITVKDATETTDRVVTSNATFYDTTNHKHFCYCGQEIKSTQHDSVINTATQTHYCSLCKLDLTADKTSGHQHDFIKISGSDYTDFSVISDLDALVDPTDESTATYVCKCGNIVNHAHDYKYGINEEHYCGCGAMEATATHEYVTVYVDESGNVSEAATSKSYQQCSICGNLKNHTHDFDYDTDCECTNPICTVTDHDYQVEGSNHVCQNCGKIDNTAHTCDVDTEEQKHVCACGFEGEHTYVNHVCDCGKTSHATYKSADTKEVNGVNVHYCTGVLDDKSVCGYVFTEEEDYGHVYAKAGDDKCTAEKCDELNPDHVHAYVNDTNKSLTVKEKCRCGADLDHVLGLPTTDFDKNHQCVHLAYVTVTDENGNVTLKYADSSNNPVDTAEGAARCGATATHTFTKVVSGETVDLDFCECGAMNPKTLLNGGLLKDGDDKIEGVQYASAHDFDAYAKQYTTDFLVSLKKAYVEVMQYDITGVTYADSSKITLAATEATQADALAAIDEFNEIWDTQLNYQAASSAVIDFVVEKYEDGSPKVNHEDRGYAVLADGTENEVGAVYGKVGETVTIQVKPNPGYTFIGWYASETPAATDKPLATTAAMEVTIKDGHFPYYAKFAENAKKTINFGEGLKYYSSITVSSSDEDWTTGTKGYPSALTFLTNEEIIIKPDTDYFTSATKAVAGITDKYGNIVSYNVKVADDGTINENATTGFNAYRTTVAYDNNYTVSTYSNATITDGGVYVQFQVGGKILAAKKLGSADVTSIAPADPEKVGFEFKGWTFAPDATNVKIEKLKTVSGSGVLYPYFEIIDDLTVTVKNGTIDSDTVKETYTYGDQILVTADLQDAAGKYFSGWYDENGNLISQYRTAKINITKSMVLTAQYTRDEELVLEAGVELVAERTTSALSLTATRYLTDDMTLVEIGMLYKVGEVDESALNIENEQLGRKYKSASDVSKKNGDYVVTLNLSSDAAKASTISAISYFIYQDAEGNNHVEYSNAVFAEPVQ